MKLLLFYVVFYLFFSGIFAIHLSAFLAVTPHPGEDVTPWNFGKYAYPNYPNSKIGNSIAIPTTQIYLTCLSYTSTCVSTKDHHLQTRKFGHG